jgi:hypothetical protein
MHQIGCRVAHLCTFEVDVTQIRNSLEVGMEALRFPWLPNVELCRNITQDFEDKCSGKHLWQPHNREVRYLQSATLKFAQGLGHRLAKAKKAVALRIVEACARRVIQAMLDVAEEADFSSREYWRSALNSENLEKGLQHACFELWPQNAPNSWDEFLQILGESDSTRAYLLMIAQDLADVLMRWPRSERVRIVGTEVVNRKEFETLSLTKEKLPLPKYWRARRRVNHGKEYCGFCQKNTQRGSKYCLEHSPSNSDGSYRSAARRKQRYDFICEEIRSELVNRSSFRGQLHFLDPRVQYDAQERADVERGLVGRIERNVRFVASLIANKSPEQIDNLMDLAYVIFEALSDDDRSVKNLTELTEIYAQKRHALSKQSLSKRLDLGGAFMTEAMSHHLRWWPLGPKRVQLFF